MMSQTEANTGEHRNPRQRHDASTAADAKAALRNEIGRLSDRLNARLPQYWRWVKPPQYQAHRDALITLGLRAQDRSLDVTALEQMCSELAGLERICQKVLSGPPRRQMRKMFI